MKSNKEILSLYAKKIALNNNSLINDICTKSSHKRIIMQTLNANASEHPEWIPSLLAISQYYKEQWVLKQDIQSYDCYDLFSDEIIKDGKFKFDLSNKITTIISNFIESESKKLKYFSDPKELLAFKAAHNLDSKDVSRYVITKYYDSSMKAFCNATNKEIKRCFHEYKSMLKTFDEDQKNAFHDTVKLIKTVRDIHKKNRVLTVVNEDNLFKLINECLLTIKKYPSDGDTMYKILKYYIYDGYSDLKIGKFCCMSETFVRGKKQLAIDILSLILWGYSTKNFLKNY